MVLEPTVAKSWSLCAGGARHARIQPTTYTPATGPPSGKFLLHRQHKWPWKWICDYQDIPLNRGPRRGVGTLRLKSVPLRVAVRWRPPLPLFPLPFPNLLLFHSPLYLPPTPPVTPVLPLTLLVNSFISDSDQYATQSFPCSCPTTTLPSYPLGSVQPPTPFSEVT